MIKTDNGEVISLVEMSLNLDGHVYKQEFLDKVSYIYNVMETAEYLLENYAYDYSLSDVDCWHLAKEIHADMRHFKLTEYAAFEKIVVDQIMKFTQEKKNLAELVEAGDWHIDNSEEVIDIVRSSPNSLSDKKALGNVYYGNDGFEFYVYGNKSKDKHLRIDVYNLQPKGFKLHHYQDNPGLNILDKYPPDTSRGLDRNNYYSRDFIGTLHTDFYRTSEHLKCILADFIQNNKNSYVSYDNINAYNHLKESGTGFFQQLDREIMEYPSKIARQSKLSSDDVYLLRNYYALSFDWDGPRILHEMLQSGFSNSQINIICTAINKMGRNSIGCPCIASHLLNDDHLNKCRNNMNKQDAAAKQPVIKN